MLCNPRCPSAPQRVAAGRYPEGCTGGFAEGGRRIAGETLYNRDWNWRRGERDIIGQKRAYFGKPGIEQKKT